MTPSTCSVQIQVDSGQQEGEHGLVQHVQGEHYQRSLCGPVCNPESSLVNKTSPKTINKSKVQFTNS